MHLHQITIIGLGLIGGSLAKALAKLSLCESLLGVDPSIENRTLATNQKIIDSAYPDLSPEVFDSDLIFICTPVLECMHILDSLAGKLKKSAIVTDVGSTKEEILRFVGQMSSPPIFIGGHPMAGAEHSGYKASKADLFENATYLITPSPTTTQAALDILTHIVTALGAKPYEIDAKTHDHLLSTISHLPHIVAAGLVHVLAKSHASMDSYQKFIGGGFKDTTRIASSNPVMWEHILLSNKESILGDIHAFIQLLEALKQNILQNDRPKIHSFFEESKAYRDRLLSDKTS
jgi:prephenate dehydrogenase